MLGVISDTTGIALGLVVVFVGLAFAAGRWMTTISQQMAKLVGDVREMVEVGKATQNRIEDHDARLTDIEYSIGIRGRRSNAGGGGASGADSEN